VAPVADLVDPEPAQSLEAPLVEPLGHQAPGDLAAPGGRRPARAGGEGDDRSRRSARAEVLVGGRPGSHD